MGTQEEDEEVEEEQNEDKNQINALFKNLSVDEVHSIPSRVGKQLHKAINMGSSIMSTLIILLTVGQTISLKQNFCVNLCDGRYMLCWLSAKQFNHVYQCCMR